MAPLIGISCKFEHGVGQKGPKKKKYYFVPPAYVKAVYTAGGIPIMIPITDDTQKLHELCSRLDGLMLIGGGHDIIIGADKSCAGTTFKQQNPLRYHFELALAKEALKQDLPVLGICLGHQILNEALGGTLNIDITESSVDHLPKADCFDLAHSVALEPHSKVRTVFGEDSIMVNSHHQQAIDTLGDGLVVTGRASDGVIECIESKEHAWAVGVQFHPEQSVEAHAHFRKLFSAFVSACKK